MKFLNPLTTKSKRYVEMVKSFLVDRDKDLYNIPTLAQCYRKPSEDKESIYSDCVRYCLDYVYDQNKFTDSVKIKLNINDWGVISHTKQHFTFGCVCGVYSVNPLMNECHLYDIALIITKNRRFRIIL